MKKGLAIVLLGRHGNLIYKIEFEVVCSIQHRIWGSMYLALFVDLFNGMIDFSFSIAINSKPSKIDFFKCLI